jgi:hypothetical protein
MRKFVFIAIFCLLGAAPCWAQSIVGTWSTSSQYNPGAVAIGVSFVTFSPDGTFRRFDQIANGQTEAVGRYRWDGHTLYYVVDDWNSKWMAEPAYHNPSTTTAVLLSDAELKLTGQIRHRQSH